MATNIDRWLKGIDHLSGLERAEIDKRLTAAEAELRNAQLKVAILTELRNRAPEGKQDDQLPLGSDQRPQTPDGDRAHDWERRAVLDLMRTEPARAWKASEVRDGLIHKGVMAADEGTPTRLLMRRMEEAGLLIKL